MSGDLGGQVSCSLEDRALNQCSSRVVLGARRALVVRGARAVRSHCECGDSAARWRPPAAPLRTVSPVMGGGSQGQHRRQLLHSTDDTGKAPLPASWCG